MMGLKLEFSFLATGAAQLAPASLRRRLWSQASKILSISLVVGLAAGLAWGSAKRDVPLGSSLCVFLVLGPLAYGLSRLLGWGVQLVRAARRSTPEVRFGVGPRVTVTALEEGVDVIEGQRRAHFEYRNLTLWVSSAGITLAQLDGRGVTIPRQVFDSPSAQAEVEAALTAKIGKVVRLQGSKEP